MNPYFYKDLKDNKNTSDLKKMVTNIEFNKNYHERSGLNYQKDKVFSRAWFANRTFLRSFGPYFYKKAENYYKLSYLELWKNFEGYNKILDIGCGEGKFLIYAPKDHIVSGTEIIDSDIEKSKKKGLNVIKSNLDKKLPFKDNTFDGILISHVIEHLESPYESLKEVKRILRAGGKLVILTPNFATDHKNFYNDPTHKRPFTKRGLFKLLYDLEFKNIRIKNDIYNSYSILFHLLNIFPKSKIFIGKIIRTFYGKSISALAEK
jgi:SAM-dependent methyltransferase